MSGIFASVWSPDLTTEYAVIGKRKGLTWQEVLNGPGMGSLQVTADDPVAQYLKARNVVRLWYQGAYRFAYRIKKPHTVVVGATNADRWLTAAGPGISDYLNDAVLYPEYGLTRQSGDQRAFNFASAQGDWYVSSEWAAPTAVLFTSDRRNPNPADFPDKSAYWIWNPSPDTNLTGGEVCYFRSSFTLSAQTNLGIFASADNWFELYLDGELILSSDVADPFAWQKTSPYQTTLASGSHLLAAKVGNRSTWATSNPAGFLCTVATVNDQGQPQTIIRHSDSANWLVRQEGSNPPGWRAAQVLKKFIEEAQARNVTAVDYLTLDFTATTDTAGQTWADLVDRTFNVGTKGGDLLEQLSELGIDFAVGPDLKVHAWKQRGTDRSTGANPVVLRPALNLSGYEVETDLGITTRLLVRTPNGWVEVADTGESTNGRIEDLLSLGNASSDAQATRQATATFTDVAHPLSTFTATCIPAAGATPYVDFGVGDTVLAPDGSGSTAALRVMGISVSEDDNGTVSFVPELYA